MAAERAQVHDITIIGGGVVGLFAAVYCGLRGASCQIVDALPHLGGQLSALYPTKHIYDVAGHPAVRAADLVSRLAEQASAYHPDIRLGTEVTGLEREADATFTLVTSRGRLRTRAIVVCAGIGAFRPRPLPLREAERFHGRGVHYHLGDLETERVRRALVVGGGDSAVDYALLLAAVAERVTVVHRRAQFRAHEDSVKRLLASRVDVRTDAELEAIEGGERVERVRIRHNDTRALSELEVDTIVSGLGFVASLGPLGRWGLETDHGRIVVTSRMETSLPGIYAAGDCATYPGKVTLIATGFGEAATAVNNAKAYLDPQAGLSPGHSSQRDSA